MTHHTLGRRVGLEPASVTVRYRGLSVFAPVTVSSRTVPTLAGTLSGRAEVRANTAFCVRGRLSHRQLRCLCVLHRLGMGVWCPLVCSV